MDLLCFVGLHGSREAILIEEGVIPMTLLFSMRRRERTSQLESFGRSPVDIIREALKIRSGKRNDTV